MANDRLVIRSRFNDEETAFLIPWIAAAIQAQRYVSVRSKAEIRDALQKGEIMLGFVDKKPAGFLFRQRIWKNYYELGGWTAVPPFSFPFTGPRMLEEVLRSPHKKFVFFTFQLKVLRFVRRYGGTKINLLSLPPPVWCHLLLSRINRARLLSIIQFYRKEKAVILGLIET